MAIAILEKLLLKVTTLTMTMVTVIFLMIEIFQSFPTARQCIIEIYNFANDNNDMSDD